jgi:vacuolar-type H+-ATPase subunit H
MKLIDEIKKAEEQGEILKKNADLEGQQLLQKTREKGAKDLAALDQAKDRLMEKELEKARKTIDTEMVKIKAEYELSIKRIDESHKKRKDKTVQQIQEIILKWPSSQ